MDFTMPPGYIDWLLKRRKAQLLHGEVERRLIQLLARVLPDYHPVQEPQGLAGGRNDLMLFEFRGRKVLFEIFATKSQVSRDLRILDKTKADVKVAVIIDKEADPGVWERIHKENPEDNYPWLFISELFVDALLPVTELKLRELVLGDEEARLRRVLRQELSRLEL